MFVKVHEQIFNSSIMEEDVETRYIWFCLLTLADKEGFVDMTAQAIARRINIEEQVVINAINKFMQPDPTSRTLTSEGRRLEKIRESFGWKIINYIHYRDLRNEENRREYMRNYMREIRDVNKKVNTNVNKFTVNSCKLPLANTDTDTETKTKDIVLPSFIPPEEWQQWIEHRKLQKKPMTSYAKHLAILKLTRLHNEGHDLKEVIQNSIENNYQGLFPPFKKQIQQKNEFGY